MCIHHISCPYVVYFVVLLHIFLYIISVYILPTCHSSTIHNHHTLNNFFFGKKSFFLFKKCKIPIFDPIFEAIVNFSIIFDAFEYGYGYDLWPISSIDFCFPFQHFFLHIFNVIHLLKMKNLNISFYQYTWYVPIYGIGWLLCLFARIKSKFDLTSFSELVK